MACTTCVGALYERKYFIKEGTDKLSFFFHHGTFKSLAQASADGCIFCAPMWAQYSDSEKERLLESDGENLLEKHRSDFPDLLKAESKECVASFIRLSNSCATYCLIGATNDFWGHGLESGERTISPDSLTYALGGNFDRVPPTSEHLAFFQLEPVTEEEKYLTETNSRLPRSRSTKSPESWAVAQSWLAKCVESHQRCNAMQTQDWLPTRLIDLEHYGTDGIVRLIDTSKALQGERYITLSHRWGSNRPYCLCEATEKDMRAGTRSSVLPESFRDAIVVCSRLQVRFIWIDSLCIRQQEPDLGDWIREAALMHKVYSCAFLNISALAAADNSKPFFADRNPEVLMAKYIRTGVKHHNPPPGASYYRVFNKGWVQQQLINMPLNLRAWVLQERLLAPRVLHFGHQQLIWECHEMDCAESYPDGLPAEVSLGDEARLKSLDVEAEYARMHHLVPNRTIQWTPYRMWNRIVQRYTACGITNGDDKLIAISGIAKHMAPLLNDQYICGLWRRYLASGLLWDVDMRDGGHQPDGRYQNSFRPARYRAPSFSWASVEGTISPSEATDEGLLIEVLDLHIEPVTEDVTGLIKGGYVLLKCQVRNLSMRRHIPPNEGFIMTVNGTEARARDGKPYERTGPLVELDEHPSYFDPSIAAENTLFCVPARMTGDWLRMLLLQVVDPSQGTYRRFGIASSIGSRGVYDREVILRPPREPTHIPAVAVEDCEHIIRLI